MWQPAVSFIPFATEKKSKGYFKLTVMVIYQQGDRFIYPSVDWILFLFQRVRIPWVRARLDHSVGVRVVDRMDTGFQARVGAQVVCANHEAAFLARFGLAIRGYITWSYIHSGGDWIEWEHCFP